MTWHVPDDEYRETARDQRSYLKELALRIERDEATTAMDRQIIAAVLWKLADEIPDRAKRQRGAEPKVDPDLLAFEFAFLVNIHGMKQTPAMDQLATRFEMTTPGVRKSLEKYGIDRALTLLPVVKKETK